MTRKPKKKPLGDQIRAAVEASEKSRYRIGKEAGIDAASLCRFVKGEVGLSLESLDQLADCLGLRIVVGTPKAKPRTAKKGR